MLPVLGQDAPWRAWPWRRSEPHDVGVQLLHHAGQRHDVEHTLASRQQIDDLAVGAGEHRAAPGQHEVGRRQVRAQLLTQALDGPAGGLERHPGVEELLDHLELEHVRVRVDPPGATALCRRQRRLQQARAGPVIELPVRDSHEPTHLRPMKPPDMRHGIVDHHTSLQSPYCAATLGVTLVHPGRHGSSYEGVIRRFAGSRGSRGHTTTAPSTERPTRCPRGRRRR